MPHLISPNIWQILVCPYCRTQLERMSSGAHCTGCHTDYPLLDNSQLDLRLQQPRIESVDFELGKPLFDHNGFAFHRLPENPNPMIDLATLTIPWHLTRSLVSYFPKAKDKNSLMLDLGCGDGVHKNTAEAFGFEWVGLDYSLPEAPIRGDAHALPFKDGSFEFILSIAVLEHIQFPFVMTQEANRVLQPGGFFIGTVSFLEPFHNDSYYHHSHLATYNSLRNAGFQIEQVSPAPEWPGLLAISEMALFRMMPSWLVRFITWPLQALHRIWWFLGYLFTHSDRSSEEYRLLSTSGAFSFFARKSSI